MKEKLSYAETFHELTAYKMAVLLAEKIYIETKSFPKEETYSLTDQIRRSSRSIGAHIAEAWGKRKYINHFSLLLTGASAELNETEHWIAMSFSCNYISNQTRDDLINLCSRIHGLIGGMKSKASQFCQQ